MAVCPCGFPREPRIFTDVSGREMVRAQCPNCGSADSVFLRKSLFDLSTLVRFDEEARRGADARFNQAADEAWNQAQRKASDGETWWANYAAYLESAQWKRKREAVLLRDGYRCQACREKTATQVHHLTYAHIGHEPLFDLVSICEACHVEITRLDREQRGPL